MRHGLEKVFHFFKNQQSHTSRTHIVFECRSKKEDRELGVEFTNACHPNVDRDALPFDIVFADKRSNSCGLQLADLVAHPIGHHVLNSSQNNRAYPLIENKLYRDQKGSINGWDLTCIPHQTEVFNTNVKEKREDLVLL